jgi:phage tail sheath protein FI
MPFQLSPGVLVKEIDLTNIVPAVATSIGAVAGAFEKGPVGEIVAIGSEKELVDIFGKPNGSNFETWFTAANFLQYGNALRVVRAESAILNAMSGGSGLLIKSTTDYLNNYSAGQGSSGEWGARTAGTHGNSLGVSMCTNATAYEQNLGSSNQTVGEDAVGATVIKVDAGTAFNVGDLISFSSADASSDATAFAHIAGDEGNEYEITAINTHDLTVRLKDDPNGKGVQAIIPDNTFIRRRWAFYDLFDAAPGTSTYAAGKGLSNDEIHIVVFDRTGDISGFRKDTAGERTNAVLETYQGLSQAAAAKTTQGGTNYYPDVIYGQSSFIYWMDHDASLSNAGTNPVAGTSFASTAGNGGVKDDNLSGGTDDYAVTVGELALAYDNFADAETVDVNLIMAGTSPAGADGTTHATKLIDIAEARKDVVAFISPRRADVVNVAKSFTQATNVKTFFDGLSSSSYAVFDSGYKYMYDKFNDTFRFVPLNGDIAGLCANTDNVADPFFSPGGFNRGQIRGAVKLAFNPNKAQRDILYPARINPVVTFPGQGTILFGDKTALAKPSAFDRINVRRLFILLEKAIATAAKFQLFEFNDEFTRAQFRNLVEPFLRDIQGRRGITDFSVVADGTNNTGEVIDRNEFVADIFIKPARSINFIQLNFIAVRTGVAFSEIGG